MLKQILVTMIASIAVYGDACTDHINTATANIDRATLKKQHGDSHGFAIYTNNALKSIQKAKKVCPLAQQKRLSEIEWALQTGLKLHNKQH